jgi:hypothetical protein
MPDCTQRGKLIKSERSAFVLHHYAGTFEQFNYREEARDWARAELKYAKYKMNSSYPVVDNSIRWWLRDFVKKDGHELANALLDNVGFVAAKTNSSTLRSSD